MSLAAEPTPGTLPRSNHRPQPRTRPAALLDRFRTLLRARDGRLTRELLRSPGRFGLGQVPAHKAPDATTVVVCGFCSTGCGLTVHLRDGQAVNLTPAAGHPVNLGMACPKGWEALTVLDAPDRATTPLLRDADGTRRPVDWSTALNEMAARFHATQARYGPQAVAYLSSGQIASEEMALLGAVAKFGMGMVHGDGNTRQCMATAAVAYKQSFGFDAPPMTYQDFEESDCIVLVGSNLCITHPIMWERVMRNRRDAEVVVVDPRRTETAASGTTHLPLRPKSDQALFYGLTDLFIQNGWVDRRYTDAHTTGFDDLAASVRRFDLPTTAGLTGLPADQILRLAETIHTRERVSFWWTMGVNQSHQGVRTAQAIINLALLSGNIGRPGTGPNSVTGQCNAMGSRLFSNTSNMIGGHDFADPAHRARVAEVLEIPEANIPTHAGRTYDQILDGVRSGEVRALWVIGTNPSHSWIDQQEFHALREKLDFLVVQDMYYSTETALAADLLLPAAGWGEKEGTFINSERRVGLIKKVRRAPGLALADFSIFRLVAEVYGCGTMFRKWESPEAAFGLMRELTRGRPCDITGVGGYAALDADHGIQWPWTEADAAAGEPPDPQRRLFADGRFFTPDGRARLLFEEPRPPGEAADDEFPLTLLTGRGSASQWHTQTRTGKSDVLRKLYPESLVAEVHPLDAEAAGVEPGGTVVVESRRGHVRALVFASATVARGQVFLPMHDPGVNRLTFAEFDPYSRQPSYKSCAVRLRQPGPGDAPAAPAAH